MSTANVEATVTDISLALTDFVRLSNDALTRALQAGLNLTDAKTLLGDKFAQWAERQLPVYAEHAELFIRFAEKTGVREDDLFHPNYMKLPELLELLSLLVGMYAAGKSAEKPPQEHHVSPKTAKKTAAKRQKKPANSKRRLVASKGTLAALEKARERTRGKGPPLQNSWVD